MKHCKIKWSKVREYTEQLERDYAINYYPDMETVEEISAIERTYEGVRDEMSVPDRQIRKVKWMEQDMKKKVDDGRGFAKSQITEAQKNHVESHARATHGLAEFRIRESKEQAESRTKGTEEEVMMAADEAAERVLQFTKHRQQ